MNNLMNKKFMEYSVKSSYNSEFVESYMKKNDLLPKEFRFRRSALDLLLKQSNKKISDFVKDTYKPNEQKNKLAQISKILNPKPNAPKYFTENDLANDLAHWFNDFLQLDETVAPNFFVGDMVQIYCIGTLFGNGQIGMHKKNERHKINIHPKYASFQAIECLVESKRGLMMLFKPTKSIDRNANNRTVICQDKKTKVHWFGFLEPKSNGKFDITDKSQSTGKTIGKLAENIQISWSAEVKAAYYPTIYNI